jgi:MFS family permease
MLRELQLSYFEYTVLAGTSVFTQFLTLTTWGRIADVYGNRLLLIVTSISLPIVPLLWLVSADFWYLIFAQAVSGLTWSGFTLGAGNLLYELVPRTRRAAYVAFHNVGTAAGVFGGAMIGAGLVLVLPQRTVFFGDAGVASSLLYLFALSGLLRAIVMRITGFDAMLDLLYDFIGRTPAGDSEEQDDRKKRE